MPYVPPHRRLSHDCTMPTPATPPSSSSSSSSMATNRFSSSSNKRADLRPELRISRSQDFIGRFLVLMDTHHSSCISHDHPQLEFERFEGQSFGHLQSNVLYSLTISSQASCCSHEEAIYGDAKAPSCPNEGTSELIARMNLNSSQTSQIHSTIKALENNITEVLEKFKALTQTGSSSLPNLWIRFGKLLFHADWRCTSGPDWRHINTPALVEKSIQKPGQIMKTFDNSISNKEFNHLQEMAHRHSPKRQKKEKFRIECLQWPQIEDQKGPNSYFWLVCTRSQNNRDTAFVSTHEGQLQLRKLRLATRRHMVVDLACIGKSGDVRLAFLTREYIPRFTEEEMDDLNSVINKVRIDENVKGGLHWPLTGMCSMSGRFKVVGVLHYVQTTLVGAGIKWNFDVCNRAEFKASWGRVTYEVGLKPCVFKDYCKGRRDWNTDDLRHCIEKVLEQTWTDWV